MLARDQADHTDTSPRPALFRERLWPTPLVWLLLLAAPGALGVAYGAAFTPGLGWVVFGVGFLITVLLVVLGSPTIVVTDQELIAGRARLPRRTIRAVTALASKGGAGQAASPTATPSLRNELRTQATAFTLIRAWSGSAGVRIDLDDAQDPHPCWLLSTRRPAALAHALGSGIVAT